MTPESSAPPAFSVYTDEYLKNLRHERGCSQTTCVTYASWLHHFQHWLVDTGQIADALTDFSEPILRTYLNYLSNKGLRPRTIRSAFAPLTGLGVYLIGRSVLTVNPCKAITLPKKDAARRLTISEAEVVALLGGVEKVHPVRRGALARALISTLVYTGVRFQELLDLKVGDISLSAGTLLVASGKGSKSRLLYPPKACLEAIGLWLAIRGECTHEWLWAINKGRRCGEGSVRDILEEVKAVSGLRGLENIKPHSLRHSLASRMMENGGSIRAIQSALGHSHTATTFQYLHLAENETKKMAEFAQVRSLQVPSTPEPQPAAPPVPAPTQRVPVRVRHRMRREGKGV